MTGNEVNFILYLSRFQNESGKVIGVYYKDVCEELQISLQGYYDLLHSLEHKGLLSLEKNNYYDVDITLIDNDFTGYDYKNIDKNAGYINTNYQLFKSKVFMDLKGPEKLLAIDWLKNYLAGKRSYAVNVQRFVQKYKELLGISRRSLMGYVKMLKIFFSIGIKDGVYYITPRAAFRKKYEKAESDVYEEHQKEVGLRRNRVRSVPEKIKDGILRLFKQYSPYIKSEPNFDFSKVVYNTLEITNKEIINPYKWKRVLNIALVHKELRLYLGLA